MPDDFTRQKFAWLDQVHGNHSLPRGDFHVSYALSQYFNRKSGDAWPSQETLAGVTGLKRRGLQKSLQRLKKNGHLEIKVQCGPGFTNRYRPIWKSANNSLQIQSQNDELEFAGGAHFGPEIMRTGRRIETFDSNPLKEHLPSKPEISSRRVREGTADGFDQFWQQYPRKVGKKAAIRAFAKALREGAKADDIIAGACRYAVEREGEPDRYTKHPATWLNAGFWEDEPAVHASALHGAPKTPRRKSAINFVMSRHRDRS